MKKKIGLFGGTFDPVHLGHLILAERAFEKLTLDQLIFIPAKISPYKAELPPAASGEARSLMLQLAIAGKKNWHVDSREIFREGPSFTIDTVKELREEHQGAHFFLLIGEDQLAGLAGWKGIGELQKLVSFVILSRKFHRGQSRDPRNLVPGQQENAMASNYRDLGTDPISIDRCIDISSTEIRERLAKNESIDYLLPLSIHDYIKTHNLYKKSSC